MASSTWFQQLFGFVETPEAVRSLLVPIYGAKARAVQSKANGRVFPVGMFAPVVLGALRFARLKNHHAADASRTRFSHIVIGDVLELHALNPGCMFQAASQFNCLEFPNNSTGPEWGVTGYERDLTQGPACALACAAGTVWRSYFAEVLTKESTVQIGQTNDNQINCLEHLENLVGNAQNGYWTVRNGYITSSVRGMESFAEAIKTMERDDLLRAIKIGVHRDVGVTFSARTWTGPFTEVSEATVVHQAYCAAVSAAYDRAVPLDLYEPLAQLVLDAAYEATLHAATICGAPTTYLTQLGGGVFGNKPEWIAKAIGRALAVAGQGLSVKICHFKEMDRRFLDLVGIAFAESSGGALHR